MNVFRHRWQRLIGWFLLFGLVLFLALNRHSRAGRFNYHSEIWSDKAGYYIYLPLLFDYSMDATQIGDTAFVGKTGLGFVIDEQGRLQTKYTFGVALSQLPFYLLANALASEEENQPPGMSAWHHTMVNVGAVFYLFLGLFFLRRFLLAYFKGRTVFLTLLTLLLATNLYYYSVFETGMSHVYSFAVFSCLLYFLQRTRFLSRGRNSDFLLFGLLCGWILVIRPSNLLFLLVYFFLDSRNWQEVKARFVRLFRPFPVLLSALGTFLLLLPQMLYWKYAYGSYLAYSYGDEGFNWLYPQWLKVLFSPNNGLLLYTPVFLLFLFFLGLMFKKGLPNRKLLLFGFLLITYVFSCWWEWGFGCAYGARSYVEYLSLFSLAFGHGFEWLFRQKALIRNAVYAFLLCCCLYTFKMIYSYSGCFPGHKNWDWQGYIGWVKTGVH